MHLYDNLIFAYLSLQLNLDGFLVPLLLDRLLDEIEQLVLVSLNLALLFLHLGDFISQLLLHLLGLKSLVSQLTVETLLHIFLFMSLEGLKIVE